MNSPIAPFAEAVRVGDDDERDERSDRALFRKPLPLLFAIASLTMSWLPIAIAYRIAGAGAPPIGVASAACIVSMTCAMTTFRLEYRQGVGRARMPVVVVAGYGLLFGLLFLVLGVLIWLTSGKPISL